MGDGVRIDPFDVSDTDGIGLRWTKWIKRLERLFEMKAVADSDKKINQLFLYGGSDLEDVYDTYKTNGEDFAAVCAKLRDHFNPKSNNQVHILNLRVCNNMKGNLSTSL